MAYFKNEFRSVLYVDDFEASTKFYGEGLELRSNYSWNDGPDDRGVKYLAAGGVIEVIRRDPPIAQGSTTLMLEAEDVNACYQAMKKKDWLIFLEDLADRPYGIRCFRLLNGKPCGKGTGSSKKRAEQAAAAAAIDALFPGEL